MFASRECAAGSLLKGANDVWKWYTCMKACQNKAHFFEGIQLAGVVFFLRQGARVTDPIAMTAPRVPPPRKKNSQATSTCHSVSLCLLMCALAWTVQSQALVIHCGFASSEKNHSCSFTSGAQARHESTGSGREDMRESMAFSHILLNVFHFNHPLLFISPIPFSSQVHLAFIPKFNSPLERVGLNLKPYRWINRAEIL